MAQASLDKLATALASIEARLSKIESQLSGPGTGAGSSAVGGASLDAFDALVSAHLPKFVADSKKIADDVGQHVRSPIYC